MGAAASARDEVVVGQPDVIEAMSTLLDSVQTGRVEGAGCPWRVVRGMSRFLTEKIVQESFDFYGRTLTGAPELRPRWKRGVALVEGLLGELVGRMYVERHYPERAQEQMSVLIDNLIRAYDERITSLDWMETETQGRAIEKLRTFTPKGRKTGQVEGLLSARDRGGRPAGQRPARQCAGERQRACQAVRSHRP